MLAGALPSEVAAVGLTGKRAESLVQLARCVADRQIALAPGVMPEATIEALCDVPGIGDWTAQYIAMRRCAGRTLFRPEIWYCDGVWAVRVRLSRNAAEACALASLRGHAFVDDVSRHGH